MRSVVVNCLLDALAAAEKAEREEGSGRSSAVAGYHAGCAMFVLAALSAMGFHVVQPSDWQDAEAFGDAVRAALEMNHERGPCNARVIVSLPARVDGWAS